MVTIKAFGTTYPLVILAIRDKFSAFIIKKLAK